MNEHGAADTAQAAANHSAAIASVFMELGAVIIGLSVLARLAVRAGLTPIPLYLLAGLCLGKGGLVPLSFSEEFIGFGAEIGVILLLFMLGLEYTGEELSSSLKRGFKGGLLDLALNLTPGFIAGLLLGWSALAALLLGGVTYISSSSIIAKVLGDLDRLGNRETPTVLSILVLEDLAMAVFLPLVAVLLLGQGLVAGAVSITIAVTTVAVVLLVAVKQGGAISRVVAHRSDEVLLLTTFGLVLLVAGIAQRMQVSAAIGAFLVGLALSGSVAEKARNLVGPLRDLFAATFFLFVGLQIEASTLIPVLPLALGLAVITALTKMATGWWAAGWAGIALRGRIRAGTALVSRGEFSVVIAGLGAATEPRLAPLSAAYVLILAVGGPILARLSEPLSNLLQPRPQPIVAVPVTEATPVSSEG
ncbi:MAG: monovalent cation:H+ antiporter-2, family [Abditibacteriota bacterium]|nr:monovalent cation:H+ antiporter-2, family [Abditibacteriota bacterium]